MNISAQLVKDLRERTGVGMMECKKALTETAGDMEKAVLWLRENGMARAQKKSGRTTAEGMVIVATRDQHGVIIELNCETDFVGKSADFQQFAEQVGAQALAHKPSSIEELKSLKIGASTIGDALTQLIAKIGENLNLRRIYSVTSPSGGVVGGYSHMQGKIGTLVALSGTNNKELAQEVAMHVAGAFPKYLDTSKVNVQELEQEKELARKKILEEGKPENMVEKILQGHIAKFHKEVCLVEQPFVKDPKLTVKQHVSQKGGANAVIVDFGRFQLGEGVDKKSEDFAAEVAKMTAG